MASVEGVLGAGSGCELPTGGLASSWRGVPQLGLKGYPCVCYKAPAGLGTHVLVFPPQKVGAGGGDKCHRVI